VKEDDGKTRLIGRALVAWAELDEYLDGTPLMLHLRAKSTQTESVIGKGKKHGPHTHESAASTCISKFTSVATCPSVQHYWMAHLLFVRK
jgi:hypothetical protein